MENPEIKYRVTKEIASEFGKLQTLLKRPCHQIATGGHDVDEMMKLGVFSDMLNRDFACLGVEGEVISEEKRKIAFTTIWGICFTLSAIYNKGAKTLGYLIKTWSPEPEHQPEPEASPALPENCRLVSVEEARDILHLGIGYVLEDGIMREYQAKLPRPIPVVGSGYCVVAKDNDCGKPTRLLVVTAEDANKLAQRHTEPNHSVYYSICAQVGHERPF